MDALESIRAAQARDARIEVPVDRWGVTLYFRQTTPRDMDNLLAKHPDFLTRPTIGALVDAIIMRAEDAAGKPMFTIEARPVLMSEPIGIINDIGDRVMRVPDAETIEKN